MKIVWVFFIINLTNPQRPVIVESAQFATEKECRAYELQNSPLVNVAAGCLPMGVR